MRFLFIQALLVLSLCGCSNGTTAPRVLAGPGTVRYETLEGGFYTIVPDGDRSYEALGLPAEFKVDGKRVFFVGRIRGDLVTAHMVPAFEVEHVRDLND